MPHARFTIAWNDVTPGRASGVDQSGISDFGESRRRTVASGKDRLGRRTLSRHAGAEDRPGSRSIARKTLVFDEVDAGIGGKAAETVGQKLKELSSRYQILCVTHLAQIAAFADHQYRIEKLVPDGTIRHARRAVDGRQPNRRTRSNDERIARHGCRAAARQRVLESSQSG